MIVCDKCGVGNPLGRVFCQECGAKLELRYNRQEIEQKAEAEWLPYVKIGVAVVVVLLILLHVIPACWSQSVALGDAGTQVGRHRVEMKLEALTKGTPDTVAQEVFTETEINGYLAGVAESLGLGTCTVDLREGYFAVRIVRPLAPAVQFAGMRIAPKYSVDMLCVPYKKSVTVGKAYFGHLRLMGPVKGMVTRPIFEKLLSDSRIAAVKRVTEIKSANGQLIVTAGK